MSLVVFSISRDMARAFSREAATIWGCKEMFILSLLGKKVSPEVLLIFCFMQNIHNWMETKTGCMVLQWHTFTCLELFSVWTVWLLWKSYFGYFCLRPGTGKSFLQVKTVREIGRYLVAMSIKKKMNLSGIFEFPGQGWTMQLKTISRTTV